MGGWPTLVPRKEEEEEEEEGGWVGGWVVSIHIYRYGKGKEGCVYLTLPCVCVCVGVGGRMGGKEKNTVLVVNIYVLGGVVWCRLLLLWSRWVGGMGGQER